MVDYRGLRATGSSMADYSGLRATGLSMADYSGLGASGFTAQYRLGATATQTAVLDASQSRRTEARDDSAPVRLPPITVHAAGALPPWATRTARIDLSQAANREFVQLRTRRGTYDDDWPHNSGIDPANMALAGFYRIGPGRRVRCFYCGLELDHLTSRDNVWYEHVRHSPTCPYLVVIMGQDEIEQTQTKLNERS